MMTLNDQESKQHESESSADVPRSLFTRVVAVSNGPQRLGFCGTKPGKFHFFLDENHLLQQGWPSIF